MRLTLRNMLAHMDNILQPEDAELIGKKIEESDYASGLLHRIRDCMRRLRLGAPDVLDDGKGLDPNTVGEYLDNTMAADDVGDFEKICLDSDVHLAEVASCHQILTMVLVGEPAEVDPESRSKMYELGTTPSAGATASSAPVEAPEREDAEPAAARSEAPSPTGDGKTELPDYIREAQAQQRRTRWIVAVVLILALGVGLLIGSGKHRALLASLGLTSPETAPVEEPAPGTPQPPAPTEELPTSVEPSEAPTEIVDPVDPSMPEPPAAPEPEALASNPVEPPADAVPEPPAAVVPEPAPEPPAEPAPVPSELVGQFAPAAPTDVLLRLDPADDTWWRLPPEAPVASGEEFVALPTHRPTIVLKETVAVTLLEGTHIQLLATDSESVPGVAVERGRLILRAVGGAEARLRLQLGRQKGMVQFVDAASEVAVEVHRPGTMKDDPEIRPLPRTIELFAVSGQVAWKPEPIGEPIPISGQQRLRLDQDPPQVAAIEEMPAWVPLPRLSDLEGRAAETVEGLLIGEKDAALALLERADHRQREVRRLILRCLAALGDYKPLVEALDDAEQKMIWPDYFSVEQLRAAVAEDPDTATAVRRVMEDRHRSDGMALYEMLWRYRPGEFTREDARRLVEYLDHDTLAIRRLSFWNVRTLAGGVGYYYEPEDTSAERRTKVQRWKLWAEKVEPAEEESADLESAGGIFPPDRAAPPAIDL